jgi:hypothetical protein
MQPPVLIHELARGRHRERVTSSLQAHAFRRPPFAASERRQRERCPLSGIAGWIASRRRRAVLTGPLPR